MRSTGLIKSVVALDENVKFIFLGQDFNVHSKTHALPGTFQEIDFRYNLPNLDSGVNC
jgi:hypothetical protein